MNDTTTELEEALDEYIRAKRAEESATARRMLAEQCILALHPLTRDEGATSFAAGDYKVTLTGSMTYKCEDLDALREATRNWDREMVPLESKTTVSATGCKWIKANRPDLWQVLAKHITAKPAKVNVRVAL